MGLDGTTTEQALICSENGVAPAPPSGIERSGIALATLRQLPLNGLSIRPEAGTSGWYIWGGTEMSEADDFFAPIHHLHIADYCAPALPFLALPPGWRFLVAPGQVDVWFDAELVGHGPR